jgi:hypothetical protein
MKLILITIFIIISGCGASRDISQRAELTDDEKISYDAVIKMAKDSDLFKNDPLDFAIVDRTNGLIFIALRHKSGAISGFGINR